MAPVLVRSLPPSTFLARPKSVTCGSDRKSTRLNSSHTVIYTLSLHDALPILFGSHVRGGTNDGTGVGEVAAAFYFLGQAEVGDVRFRSEEHTSELQSHSDLHSFPTRRSSDLVREPCKRGYQRWHRCW